MNSLRARLFVSFTSLLAAALVVFGVIVWLLARDAMSSDIDDFLRGKAMLLSRLNAPVRLRIEPWMEQDLQVHERNFMVQMFTADGTSASKSSNMAITLGLTDEVLRSGHPAGGVIMETLLVGGLSYRVATHPRRDQWGGPVVMYAQALMALDDLHAREQRLRTWLFAGGLVMLSSGAAASWALSRLWLRSVTVMEETARNLGAGDLGRRRLFVPSDDAELAALAGAFNNLLDRLEVAHTAQQRFTADASHELRTPLTILRGEIEVALRRPRSAEEYRDVLLSNKEEIERLSRLTENMLALAHVDVGDAVAQREPVNMAEVCSVVTAKLQPLAAEKGIALTLDAPDDGGALSVMGDRVALERVMHNLVENAIRYTPPNESVNVRLSKQDAQVRVDVSDSGSGIAPEHLPLLFDRFYRVDKARSRAHGGSGLGLSIVRALVEAHGGTVQVESQVGSGSTFTVRLPAAV